MIIKTEISIRASGENLEAKMQKVSLVVSVVGLGLMCLGFLDWLLNETSFLLPGDSVPSLSSLLRLQSTGLSLVVMSAGIVLLGMIPTIRVTLACWLYLRERDLLSALIALIVLLELMLSIRLSV
jgi:uncharacterized membrane protein